MKKTLLLLFGILSIFISCAQNNRIVANTVEVRDSLGTNKKWIRSFTDDTTDVQRKNYVPTEFAIKKWTLRKISGLTSGGGGSYTAGNGVVIQGSNIKLQDTLNGAGSKFIWMPAKSAIRAGSVNGSQWDVGNIGSFSTAFGQNNTASESYTFAAGYMNNVKDIGAWAIGYSNTTDAGFSGALGTANNTRGSGAIAIGNGLKTKNAGAVAVGTYNDTTIVGSTSSINNTANRIFQIGVGPSDDNRKNALTVLQSGKIGIGTNLPDSLLHIVGGFKLQNGSQGAGKVLTSGVNGEASWLTPNTDANITASSGLVRQGQNIKIVDSLTGSGTRFQWSPQRSSFRAGFVSGNDWNMDSIAYYSTAFGYNNKVRGFGGFAIGENNVITNNSGYGFIAGSGNTLNGTLNQAVFGNFNEAFEGSNTLMSGTANKSYKSNGGIFGSNNINRAESVVMGGVGNIAKTQAGTIFGNYNDTTVNSTNTHPNIPASNNVLFQIGNGTGNSARSSAITVLQNGRIGIKTPLPDSILHIVGGMKYQNGSEGAGKFLMSDATGGASWQNAPAGNLQGILAAGNSAANDILLTNATNQGLVKLSPYLSPSQTYPALTLAFQNTGGMQHSRSFIADPLGVLISSRGGYNHPNVFNNGTKSLSLPIEDDNFYLAKIPNSNGYLGTTVNGIPFGANGNAVINAISVGAENSLGNPSTDGYVLSSTITGTRSWIPNGGISLNTISGTPNANGMSLSGGVLRLQPANEFFGGVITTTSQKFAGVKEYIDPIRITNNDSTVKNILELGYVNSGVNVGASLNFNSLSSNVGSIEHRRIAAGQYTKTFKNWNGVSNADYLKIIGNGSGTNTIQFPSLTGADTRMLTVNTAGNLGTQSIASLVTKSELEDSINALETRLLGDTLFFLNDNDPLYFSHNLLTLKDTLRIKKADGTQGGFLSSTDFSTFNNKQSTLVSGTNIKTINGNSILGSGDLTISGGGGSGTVNTGAANRLAYYPSATTTVDDLAAITANRAVISDANGLPTHATTTATEIGYVNGVTSAIQTQINTKAPSASPTFTGTVVLPSTTSIGAITNTELAYVDGVTSGIQTQLDGKQPLINKTPSALTFGSTTTWAFGSGMNRTLTMTGNTTLAITGDADGDVGCLLVTQDGTGGWLFTFPAGDNVLMDYGKTADVGLEIGQRTLLSYIKIGGVRYWNATTRDQP